MDCKVTLARENFTLKVNIQTPGRCDWLGVMGASGAGKSTLLRSLAGLNHTAKVTGSWGSVPLASMQATVLVSQQTPLFPAISVNENLTLVAKYNGKTGADINNIVSGCECAKLQNKMPSQLSGGEVQRVILARALLAGPSLLLLDEAFSAMDTALKHRVLNWLREYCASSIKVILVSHDLTDLSNHCQHIVELDQGRITDHDELFSVQTTSNNPAQQPNPEYSALRGTIVKMAANSVMFCVGEFTITKTCISTAHRNVGDLELLLIPTHSVMMFSAADAGTSARINRLKGKVSAIAEKNQGFWVVTVECAGQEVMAYVEKATPLAESLTIGDTVFLEFAASSIK